MRFTDKTAIITGGTQGLGKAIAHQLASEGITNLVICGRNAANGNAVIETLSDEFGTDCAYVQADLAHVDQCRNVVSTARKRFGVVDILVNVAAITDRGNLLDTSEELFDSMFAVNVRAPFFLMQETTRLMIDTNTQGSIVNIGSIAALAGQPFIIAYCASKGALATLTRNAAFSLLHNCIRVNQLNIGWMESDGEDSIQRKYHGATSTWAREAAKKLPAGRLLQPPEVAMAVAFLASNDSGMMTGSVINFDQSVWGASDGPPASPVNKLVYNNT